MAGTEGTNITPPLEVSELGDGSASVVLDDDDDHDDDGAAAPAPAASEAAGEQQDAAGLEGSSLSDPEREAIRERRRQERHNKKTAAREREDNLRTELASRDRAINEMREKLLSLEQRNTSSDLAQLDLAAKRAKDAVSYYKGVIETATTKQDGAVVADATERMMAARQEADRLAQVKQSFVNSNTGQQQALDPTVKAKAESWASRNTWYKPDGSNQDSEVVLTIDRRLAADGFDPRTDAYWAELDARVGKYLPHAKKAGYTGGTPQERSAGTPVTGSGREGGAGNGSRNGSTYQLSAQRVQALKDAGVWDDPKARSDAIRRYRDYDKKSSTAART